MVRALGLRIEDFASMPDVHHDQGSQGSREYFWFALVLVAVLIGYAVTVPAARGTLSADQTLPPIDQR
jgi:hypothetical protein